MSDNVSRLIPQAAPPPARAAARSKGDQVAARIRDMIVQDELPPGAPIRERLLAERLNVSRTPLREALKILAAEGLVEHRPNRGAVVAAPSDEEVRELLQLLGVLEAFAGELACANRTDGDLKELRALHFEMMAAFMRDDALGYFRRNQDIHLRIVACSLNKSLIDHHWVLNARVYRVRYVCNLRTRRWQQAIEEHEAMLDALEARDGRCLADILRGHVLNAWDKMQAMPAEPEVPPAAGAAS